METGDFVEKPRTVVDLFSGAGGMSCGFHRHPSFRVIGAADAQTGKPSSGRGTLECNRTYKQNIGVEPLAADLSVATHEQLAGYLIDKNGHTSVDVLISCAPCTGFSRTIRKNLVRDDPRNMLISTSVDFVNWFEPDIFLMENVGELIEGRFRYHYSSLQESLDKLGYVVHGSVHPLNKYGLPQRRSRALVIAVKRPLKLRTLDELWEGYRVQEEATYVRRAIGELPPVEAGQCHPSDPMHISPNFSKRGAERLKLIPPDGGSWADLLKVPYGDSYLIPSMKRNVERGKVGPHPDVYGRLSWDAPAVTLKRECSHTGNGRYAHPEQHRLCTVREMAILQGFPRDFEFVADSLSNMYRHLGDAVPPLIAYQLAWLCEWILTGGRPPIEAVILPRTHLQASDIVKT